MIASLLILLAVNPAAAQDCPDVDDLRIQESSDQEIWRAYDSKKNLISMATTRYFRVTSSNVDVEGTDVDNSDELVPADSCDCEWSIDPTSWSLEIKGGLDKYPEVLNPRQNALYPEVSYIAPVDLLDCLDEQVLIKATCDNGREVATIELIVTPQDSDGDNEGADAPQFDTPCTVSGGGCTSPQSNGSTARGAVWLIFPLLGLGGWVRRRD